ncbi:MAG TPA: hypothetical protein VN634_02535 [Candidatus Limnocylindrales bacterium]|nr:hypothetical protein [Candidatus Limnocylindrales bacterium]
MNNSNCVRRHILLVLVPVVAVLAGSGNVAHAADPCTSTAVSAILSAYLQPLELDLDCAVSSFTHPDPQCATDAEYQALYDAFAAGIAGSCSAEADQYCAGRAYSQYADTSRLAITIGTAYDKAVLKCRKAMAVGSVKLAKKSTAILQECNERALAGETGYGPNGASCTDSHGTPQSKIASAEEKLRKRIIKGCSGADHAVGGGDDVNAVGDTCAYNQECSAVIDDLGDAADCVVCNVGQDVDQAVTGAFALPLPALTACRIDLARKYTGLARKSIQWKSDCQHDVIFDGDAPPCPTVEVLANVSEEETNVASFVGTSCAGLDPQDDLGFPESCPAVGDCGSIDAATLSGTLDCLRCVTSERTDELVSSAYAAATFEATSERKYCRRAIGDLADDFARRKLSLLELCESDHTCGQTSASCPDDLTTSDIADERAYGSESIVDACTASDPQDLGFPTSCPDVAGCGGMPTETRDELITCLTCISDNVVDELRALYVP